MSEKKLDIFTRKKLLPIKGTFLKACTNCLISKQHRVTFHKFTLHRRSYVLDLIHTDIGTIDARILGCALYFVTFINECLEKYEFCLEI